MDSIEKKKEDIVNLQVMAVGVEEYQCYFRGNKIVEKKCCFGKLSKVHIYILGRKNT